MTAALAKKASHRSPSTVNVAINVRFIACFSSSVSNPDIDRYYETAMAGGALGGKITGAGGGGFSVNVDTLNLVRDGDDPESVGRTFTHVRSGMLSADVPSS